MDIKGWYGRLSSTERMMLLLIFLLLVAIATRWGYVKKEAGEAWRDRLKIESFRH